MLGATIATDLFGDPADGGTDPIGQTIRLSVDGVSIQGRSAQGVVLFRLDEGERVVSVERIEEAGEGEA